MTKGLPPKALVKTWVFILVSNHEDLQGKKSNALLGIEMYFGSIELAKIYVEHGLVPQLQTEMV